MYCQNCGKEIKENQKFCTKCGALLKSNGNRTKNIVIISCIVFFIIFSIICCFLFFNNQNLTNNIINQKNIIPNKVNQQKEKTPDDILEEIKIYQSKYWEIIKRNDLLLRVTDGNDIDLNHDSDEFNRLYKEVKSKIDKNNIYFKKYQEILKQYGNNSGETDEEMINFETENYNAIDKLLNEVYKAVKLKLSAEDFEKLKIDEKNWIKDVNAYHKYAGLEDTKFEYGNFVRVLIWSCEVDMRSFRTLLLMLYL